MALSVGAPAPTFALKGASGKTVDLSQYKGKTVVVEWLNHGCPFVRKHYDSGHMQKLQEKYTKQGVVWLSVISSASGKQGHVDEKGAMADKEKNKSFATDILLDVDGKVGKAYEAKTTPHMFIISADGNLAYQGAIDSEASADQADIPKAKNYVAQALDELQSKKAVSVKETKSYGCSVKY
jgi:peroxiredoxin